MIYVQNKCPRVQKVVLRGAWGRVIAQGSINPGQWWNHYMDANNCHSCNIGTNTGKTLLAEWSHKGNEIWWNLSTDAGYQYPPMRFYATQKDSPQMYCNHRYCRHGHPGDSHINVSGGQYNLVVQYCG
ncbi:unnamed protein product [Adineta steineri]|uniref:Uncharacterized protein n=1 Tax=Adineta steineri TaxID=433720 RepID=A0A815R185_9BILA|nr:unnamed protein product [Adineta steineri]CAF4087910.1 unnamed protein product [Adineta steineri]